MKKTLLKRWRAIVLLLLALVCIYASQYIPIHYGSTRQTVAAEFILFMIIGAPLFLLFDFLMGGGKKGKSPFATVNIIYVGLVLVFGNEFVSGLYHTFILSWLNLAIYTAYFFYLICKAIFVLPLSGD